MFYIHTDACTDVNVGMGIGILLPETMILKSTIDKLASSDEKEIPAVSDLVQEIVDRTSKYITNAGIRRLGSLEE